MGSWTATYKATRDVQLGLRGPGATSATGAALPKMRAYDAYAMLVPLIEPVLAALRRASGRDRVVPGLGRWAAVSSPDGTVSVQEWLTLGLPSPGGPTPRARWLASTPTLYESITGQAASEGPTVPYLLTINLIATSVGVIKPVGSEDLIDALLIHWDRCLQLAGARLALAPVFPNLPPEAITAWWSGWWKLLMALEQLGEQPIESASVVDALKHAGAESLRALHIVAETTGDLAGRAAAEGAKIVGESLGMGVSGFFDQAGITAWIVVGGAIYLAVTL